MKPRFPVLPFLALSVLALAPACNTGEGQGGGTPGASSRPAFGDFLVTDAAVDELFSFRVEVERLQLVRLDDTRTENLLAEPISLDLLGLRERADWLAATAFPSGTYQAVVLGFTAGGFQASDLAGDPLDVLPSSLELTAGIAAPFEVSAGSYARFLVDADLAASLTGGPAQGFVVFDPVGSADVSDGAVPLPVDALDAQVLLRDTGSLALAIEGFADGDHTRSLGTFDVAVDSSTVLVDPQGFLFDQTAFFYTLLVPGVTLAELHGSLGEGGVFLASRLEIEAQDGIPGSRFPVKLTGTLVERGPGPQLVVRLRSIVRGAAIFGPILERQDDPRTIVLLPDARTRTFDELGLVTAADLPLGGELDLKLEVGAGSPFPVLRIGLVGLDSRFSTPAD